LLLVVVAVFVVVASSLQCFSGSLWFSSSRHL